MVELYNLDCLEMFKSLKDESIDLVVTDPPYRVISGGHKGKTPTGILKNNDGKIFEYNDINFEEWIPEIYRVLKDDGDFYCMTNVLNLQEVLNCASKCGFNLHNILVWEKNNVTPNRWYMKNCEFTCYFYKKNAKTINNPSSKQVHQFDNPQGNKLHPTEKPVELMRYYIENSSNENDIVLDPFMGGGSTGVACKQCGRNFIGCEIDKKYFDIAQTRINNTTSLKKNKTIFDLGAK